RGELGSSVRTSAPRLAARLRRALPAIHQHSRLPLVRAGADRRASSRLELAVALVSSLPATLRSCTNRCGRRRGDEGRGHGTWARGEFVWVAGRVSRLSEKGTGLFKSCGRHSFG